MVFDVVQWARPSGSRTANAYAWNVSVNCWDGTMPEHGHSECPHCDVGLEGAEVTCPACSGPLFGIAPKEQISTPDVVPDSSTRPNSSGLSETTIGEISVPTYTPGGLPTTSTVGATVNTGINSNQGSDVHSLIQEGEALGLVGDHDGATAAFNRAIAIDPSNHMAWFNRGVMSEGRGDVEDAIKAFNLALENHPEHGASSANLAVLMDRIGKHDQAKIHAHAGLVAFPGHPALVEIVKRDGGEVPEIVISAPIEPAIEIHDDLNEITDDADVPPTVELENLDESAEEDAESTGESEDVWAEPVGNVRAFGSPTEVEVSEEIMQNELDSTSGIDLDQLADSAADLIKSGDSAAALESLREHLPEAASEHAHCWRIAAGAMARLELTESAIEAFTYALDLDDTDAQGWFNLGTLQRRSSNLADAVACFSKALALNPSYTKAANGLALASLENGEIEGAIEAFRKLLSLEPGHSSSINYCSLLIELAEGEGRVMELVDTLPTTLPEGPDMAREALGHLPLDNSVENVALRARAHSINGDHAEAVTLWKGLLEADKSNAELWMGLSKALSAAGSEDKAVACREKARALGAQVAEPTPVAPIQEPEMATTPTEDLWADVSNELEDDGNQENVPIPTAQEIVAHEAALDIVSEPEPIHHEPVDENVDLAAAVLEAQSASSIQSHEVIAESSSIANQDIEWYNKGIELLTKDRYSEALSCFDRALPSFKDDNSMAIKILNGRGNCFYYMEQYKEAIESYFKAFGIDKKLTTGNALYNMGTAYAELESYENAIHCFNQAIGREVGESLKGENKKRCKEQIRRCKLLLKEKK